MALVVIAGIVDDDVFQHVALIATYLSSVLPDFKVRQISKKRQHWDAWIKRECRKRGWHRYKSPLVWKEIAMSGGIAVLLGGASGFWEYLKEYYDILSYFNTKEKEALCLDKFKLFVDQEKREKELLSNFLVRRVCIVGAGHPMTPFLLMELLCLPQLALKDGLVVSLCDAKEFRPGLRRLASDASVVPASPGLGCVRVVSCFKSSLDDCDMCIILQHLDCERNGQDLIPWLQYNRTKMLRIADALKARAPHKCRVILAGVGDVPTCFNAHVIIDNAPNLCARNVVAVTADLALESIGTLAKVARIPRATVGQPPVWGYVGLNQMVDLNFAYHVVDIFRPDPDNTKHRVLGSTLQPGTQKVEVRNLTYLLDHKRNLHLQILAKKLQISSLTERAPYLAKVRATVDLIKHWFSDEDHPICLSLAVCSNGTFGLPRGLYFSQPVTLINGFWRPFGDFPLPMDVNCRLIDLVILPFHILKHFHLGKRANAIWLFSEARRTEMRKKVMEHYENNIEEKRKLLMESWKDKMKDMTMDQQMLAWNTAKKVEALRRRVKEEKRKTRVEKERSLRRSRIITRLKERRKEEFKKMKEVQEDEEVTETEVEEESEEND